MAALDVVIYQDNVDGACNLLACHSPLVFLIDQEHNGLPVNLYCDVYGGTGAPVGDPLGTFLCAYDRDISGNVRRFRFMADKILRGYMEDFDDFVQTAESVKQVEKVTKDFILRFYDEADAYDDTVQVVAFSASRQFGDNPALTDVYGNTDTLYLAGSGKPVYIYFFNDTAGVVAKIVKGITEYSLGGETDLIVEEFDTWTGLIWDTRPVGWGLVTNPVPSEFWRVYEATAGESTWVLNGNQYKYFGIRRVADPWLKGVEVWCEITYRGGGPGVYFFNNAIPFGAPAFVGGGRELTYSAGWSTVEYKFYDYSSLPGNRYALVGFYKMVDTDYTVEISQMTVYMKASNIGYYRLKVQNLTVDTDFEFYQGATLKCTKTVRVRPFCTNNKLLKYLDKSGRYRFIVFNQFWEMKDNPQLLGKTNKLITSILTDQADARAVGYRNERRLSLTADDVAADELVLISEAFTSPRVYLNIAVTGDDAKDWLEVTIEPVEKLVRTRKGNYSTVNIDVILPEQYNISMI